MVSEANLVIVLLLLNVYDSKSKSYNPNKNKNKIKFLIILYSSMEITGNELTPIHESIQLVTSSQLLKNEKYFLTINYNDS